MTQEQPDDQKHIANANLARFKLAKEVVLLVIAVVGGFIGLSEWFEEKELRKTVRTLSYIDEFEDPAGALNDHRQTIRAFFDSKDSDLQELSGKLSEAVPEMREVELRHFMRKATEALEDDGLELLLAVDAVVFHLDSIDLCVCSEVCNSRLAVQGLGDFSRAVFWWFGGHVAQQRERTPTYGLGIEKIARAFVALDDQICFGEECFPWRSNAHFRCEYASY